MIVLIVCTMTTSHVSQATGPDPDFLRQFAETYRFRLGKPSSIKVTPDGDAVLFLRSSARSFVRDLYSFDPTTAMEKRLLSASDLLGSGEETLTAEEKARRERQRLAARGIARYQLSDDGERILISLSGTLYVVERRTGAVRKIHVDGGSPIDARFSPDGQRVAYVTAGNLHLVDIASGDLHRLTNRKSDTVTYGLAEFVAQEEMDRDHGYWFSPDGRRVVVQRTDTAGMEVFRIADPMNPETAAQTSPYPRAGAQNANVRLALMPTFDLGDGPDGRGNAPLWIEWDHDRYPYLATVKWPKQGPLTIVVQNRHQTEEAVLQVDPRTGKTETLLVERDAAWLELDQDVPHWLPDAGGFLWTTERNGALQLELRAADGTLRHALTEPEFGFRKLAHVDAKSQAAFVIASPDPTVAHVWRVPLDPAAGEPVRLTKNAGLHSIEMARDRTLSVITSSLADGPWQATVTGHDAKVLGHLDSVAETPSFTPTTEWLTVGDAPSFHVALTRPRVFDAARTYPVIVHVYGGPTSLMVQRNRDRYAFAQWMADHGYMVVSIDGRGTPRRGREWHRAIRGDFISQPLDDQITALDALAAQVPGLDLERVGIYGWSFGGYFSAMAAMRRGDRFHASVAGAPVTDWRDYDTHYTERYVGLPQEDPAAYERSSVLTFAEKLERPLLIVHGTADDNVYFLHALKMSNALFRAGRHHEFLALAGFTHMVPDPLVTERLYGRIMSFFDRNLTAKVPPAPAVR